MLTIMGGDTGQTVVPEISHSEHQQERQICGEIPVYGVLVVKTTGHNFLIGHVNGDPARVRHMMNAHLDLSMTRTWPPVGRHAIPVLIPVLPVKILVETPAKTRVKILARVPARTPVGVPVLQPAQIPARILVTPVLLHVIPAQIPARILVTPVLTHVIPAQIPARILVTPVLTHVKIPAQLHNVMFHAWVHVVEAPVAVLAWIPAQIPVEVLAHIHNVRIHAKVHVDTPAMQHAGIPAQIPVEVPVHIHNARLHAKVHVEGLHVLDAGISTAILVLMKTPVGVPALDIHAIIYHALHVHLTATIVVILTHTAIPVDIIVRTDVKGHTIMRNIKVHIMLFEAIYTTTPTQYSTRYHT
jgi:hypothetical protein